MRIFRGLDGLCDNQGLGAIERPVATVGVFDGVHRGHRQLLYELSVWARSVEGTPCVLTFAEHPRATLTGTPVPMILTLEHRMLELERHGVEVVVLLDFAQVRDLPARDFLEQVVRDRLGCQHLLLGFDSHLGKGRDGTPATLPKLGGALGIEVRVASPVRDKAGEKVGSSAIRAAIQRGDLGAAANVLGRPVCLRGPVVHGAGRGSGMGVATANLDVSGQVLPPDGVYLVRVFLGAETAPAIANLGVPPTFGAGAPRRLEVHVPGWSRDLYGQTIEVRLVRRIREEQRFEDEAALRAQIKNDLAELQRSVADGEI